MLGSGAVLACSSHGIRDTKHGMRLCCRTWQGRGVGNARERAGLAEHRVSSWIGGDSQGDIGQKGEEEIPPEHGELPAEGT